MLVMLSVDVTDRVGVYVMVEELNAAIVVSIAVRKSK